MSNMISEPTQIDSEPTIKNKLRKVTFNTSNFSSPQLTKWNQDSQQRQNLLLRNICKKFTVHQQDIIREKSSQEISLQLKDLKHKLRHTLQKQNIQKIMSESQSTKRGNYLDKVLREKTEIVDIGKKYHKKIKLKLTMFNEADQIVNQKGSYKEWYDHNRNSFANSPMYHQMNYLLDKDKNQTKLSKKSKINLRNTLDEQVLTNSTSCYIRKKRNYEQKVESKRTKNKI